MLSISNRVAGLIDEASRNKAKLVTVVDQILSLLADNDLSYRMKIPPQQLGTHPKNRNGYGVSGPEVHQLGWDIFSVGFSASATSHAVCIEDNQHRAIERYNMAMCTADEKLSQPKDGQVRYGTLSCGHTNQWLNCILAEVPTDITSLQDDRGRISASKLSSDTQLSEALKSGIEWLVLKAQVEVSFPQLPDLIQEAKNMIGTAQRPESEVQLLLKISQHALQYPIGEHVDWKRIAFIAQTPSCKHDCAALAQFASRWGGHDLMKELMQFHTTHVKPNRCIGPSTFIALSKIPLTPQQLCPFFVIAVLKCQFTCPPDKVRSGICQFISPSDITSLSGKKLPAMLAAEKILRECREFIASNSLGSLVHPKNMLKYFGYLDTRAVRVVLSKECNIKTVEEGAAAFCQGAIIDSNAVATITNPWASHLSSTTTSSSSSSHAFIPNTQLFAGFVPIAAHKQVVLQNGFACGASILDIVSQQPAKIHNISDAGDVEIVKPDGSQAIILHNKFLATYSLSKMSKEILSNWKSVAGSTDFQSNTAKCRIMVALEALHAQHTDPQVQLISKPRGIVALAKFAKNKLILVPATNRIAIANPKVSKPANSLDVDNCWLLPPVFEKDSIEAVPAWFASHTPDESAANMMLTTMAVEVEVKSKKGSTANVSAISTINVPVIVNKDAVQVNQELLLYRPAPQPVVKIPKRLLTASHVGSPQKQRKTM